MSTSDGGANKENLTPEEKKAYGKILKELEANKDYYTNADSIQITETLINKTGIEAKELYALFKKIAAS